MQQHERDESLKQFENAASSRPANSSSSSCCSKKSRQKHSASTGGTISFVSFDTNPTQEARKAVRKQAALASAAARKATIAKKLAKQKEAEHQRETQVESVGDAADVIETACESKQTKRKRASPEPLACVTQSKHIQLGAQVDISHEDGSNQAVKAQSPRMITSYISPAQSEDDDGVDEIQGFRLIGPCRCLECRTAVAKRCDIVVRAGRTETPWQSSNWSTPRGEYHKLNESPHPPSPESMPGPQSIYDDKADPFSSYPVEYYPIYDKLLHHMLTVFAPRGWPTLKISRAEGLEWEHWMTQISLKEPAFFYVRLLFACGDLIRLQQIDSKVAVWLRALAIQTINEALSDPARAISDGLILAVGRIALTESLYGDRNSAVTVHRPAQKRMIDLRGGFAALKFPALVRKLMRWADNMMAIQSGTERILGDADEEETSFGTCLGVAVMEKWAPHQAKALRKKITISDLVT